MQRIERLRQYVDRRRELIFELVRIYLGLGLFAKGVWFISHMGDVTSLLERSSFQIAGILVIGHLVALAHLCGGAMLAVGLVTRLAAAVQVPVLFGAVFIVNLRQGFFGPDANLELSMLVLFLLMLSVVHGGGRLSADWYLARSFRLHSVEAH